MCARESILYSVVTLHPCCRAKIDNIVRNQQGIPDPDAPNCAESTRFWATVGGRFEDRELMSVSMTSEATVASSGETMASLMSGSGGEPSASPTLAITNGASGGPSLEALVGVMNSSSAAPAEKAKAKAKAKGAAKNPALQAPKTPAEQREAARTLFEDSTRLHFPIF